MKKRAWVSATIQTEVEWDDKNELGYIDALKNRLSEAKIAEFNGTEIDSTTTEWECENCYEFKKGFEFRKTSTICDECHAEEEREVEEEQDDRDDLRDR